jgi:hypothetical protein
MKQTLIAIVLIAVGSVLAHLYVVSQTYHPVARIDSPEGLVFTAVQDPTQDRRDCGAANERFLGPIKHLCKDCKVVLARCERELDAYESAVYEGRALNDYQITAPGMRLAIAGPWEMAKENCVLMASALQKMGAPTATCIAPQPQLKAEKKKAS